MYILPEKIFSILTATIPAGAVLNTNCMTYTKGKENISHSITTRNHPLPVSLSHNIWETFFLTLVTGFEISFTVIFGMSFLIASYVIFLIKERAIWGKSPRDCI
jgi:hypothetical protein